MVLSSSATVDAPMRIGGRDVATDEWITVINPADTREEVGRVPKGDVSHVRAAVDAADAAFPVWSAVPPAERAATLRAAGQALSVDAEARAILATREGGALLSEARRGVLGCTRVLDYYAKVGETFLFEEELPSPNGRVTVVREPMGVTGLIVPWNAPVYLGFLNLGPILMAGNTVVVKPPSDAPLALMDSLRVIEPLFPVGTINVVTGPGPTVGIGLASDPLVRKVNFTGSSAAGKEVLQAAAPTIKRVSLELGGNDPAIVFEDVDLDFVVPELIRGVFALSGQSCYDVKRIYVHQSRHREFAERFTATVDTMVVGNGLDPRSSMGPLSNKTQHRWVSGLIDDARARGATVEVVGRKLDADAWEHGYYLLPAIVTDVDQSFDIVSCEQFGPVIPIIPFRDEDEAVAFANDSQFGLASSVWTPDEERGLRIARRIQAGSTFLNVHRGASDVDMPFGGFKESGLGRGHGVIALEEQFELHTISSRRPG